MGLLHLSKQTCYILHSRVVQPDPFQVEHVCILMRAIPGIFHNDHVWHLHYQAWCEIYVEKNPNQIVEVVIVQIANRTQLS